MGTALFFDGRIGVWVKRSLTLQPALGSAQLHLCAAGCCPFSDRRDSMCAPRKSMSLLDSIFPERRDSFPKIPQTLLIIIFEPFPTETLT